MGIIGAHYPIPPGMCATSVQERRYAADGPVMTIDGPSGAGKGTLCQLLAEKLGWHLLDSGAIYRVLALAALHHDVELDAEAALVPLAANLDVQFQVDAEQVKVVLEGEDVSRTIRTEEVGNAASKIAAFPRVREALLRRQRAFRQAPVSLPTVVTWAPWFSRKPR